MIDIIKNALKEAEIKTWRINEKKEHTAEVFFIRRRQDMRRIRDTHKYNVEVFCDYEKDGKPMRGRSQVTIVPSQSEQEVLTLLKEAKHAASFAGNPYYELPEKQACAPIAAAGSLAEVSAEEAAKRFAAALFAADNDPRAFVNSAEIFSKQVKTRILGDNGTDVCYYKNDVDGEFVVQCKEPEDVEVYHAFGYDNLNCDALREKVTTALREVADRAIARAELPSGTYNLILSGENAAEVLSYYIARSSAGMVYPGYSTWKVGTDVQPEMKDGERLNMTLRAKVPFSSEAIPMKDRPVIADGKVETLHGGARMSYYLGIEPTGDYSACSCENGSVSFEEMKKEPYLYAVTFSDFQMDTMSGHFGGEIRLAYLFDGERVRIVTGGSVNGSINACSGGMKFTTERYDSKNYSGPFAVMLPGVRVAGSLAEQE